MSYNISNIETLLTSKIAALDGTETLDYLFVLKRASVKTSVNTSALDTAIQTAIDNLSATDDEELLLVGRVADELPRIVEVTPIKGIRSFSSTIKADTIVTADGATYLRKGNILLNQAQFDVGVWDEKQLVPKRSSTASVNTNDYMQSTYTDTNGDIYIASSVALFRSTDDGTTFTKDTNNKMGITKLSSGRFISCSVATTGSFTYSDTGAAPWTAVASGYAGTLHQVKEHGAEAFILTNSTSAPLRKTSSNGTAASAVAGVTAVGNGFLFGTSSVTIFVDRGTTTISVTTDGTTWQSVSTGLSEMTNAIGFYNTNDSLFYIISTNVAKDKAYVITSSDAITWSSVTTIDNLGSQYPTMNNLGVNCTFSQLDNIAFMTQDNGVAIRAYFDVSATSIHKVANGVLSSSYSVLSAEASDGIAMLNYLGSFIGTYNFYAGDTDDTNSLTDFVRVS